MWVQWHHWRTGRPELKDTRNLTLTTIPLISIVNAERLYGACHQTNVPTDSFASKAKLKTCRRLETNNPHSLRQTLTFESNPYQQRRLTNFRNDAPPFFFFCKAKKKVLILLKLATKGVNWHRIKWRTNEDTFDASHCSELLHVVRLFLRLCALFMCPGSPPWETNFLLPSSGGFLCDHVTVWRRGHLCACAILKGIVHPKFVPRYPLFSIHLKFKQITDFPLYIITTLSY